MAELRISERWFSYGGFELRAFSVEIDGRVLSDSFPAFDASSTTVASQICNECYAAFNGSVACCNDDNIVIRRHEETIYWFLADNEMVRWIPENIPLNQVWSFTRHKYESQLAGNTSALPDFSSADIRLILSRGPLHSPRSGLFTIPDLDDDPQGRNFLELTSELVRADDITPCPAPPSFRTIRIGIEAPGIPETVVDAGRVEGICAVRFVSDPAFPLWVTSEEIQRRMTSYAQ